MTIAQFLAKAPVIPVLTVDHVQDAAPLADALATGGLPVLEVTLRTPAAVDVIAAMKAARPDLVVGAGTILSADDLARAKDVGADFIVTPGVTPSLLEQIANDPTPMLPGAATLSEVMRLLEAGFAHQKFFPAEPAGGASALKAFGGPLPHVTFCPTGGIRLNTAASYLSLANVACVGGTWVATREAIADKAWPAITMAAREAAQLAVTG